MVYISPPPLHPYVLHKGTPPCWSTCIGLPPLRSRVKHVVVKPFNFIINNNNKEEEIKKKKTKKKESGGTVDNVDISNPITRHLHLDDNLVCDILSRLPAKSLMSFKCVCKNWLFLIEQDRHLHDLHLKRSMTKTPERLLVGINLLNKKDDNEDWFLSAKLLIEGRKVEAAIETIGSVNSWVYDKILKPVNGLICFINSESSFDVRVCNPCTREATPWIKSTLLMKQKEEYGDVKVVRRYPRYGFGYDPVTKEHKVICVWKISRSTKRGTKSRKINAFRGVNACKQIVSVCEILTVGHNSWRKIGEVPPYDLKGESVYANGSIYWINCSNLKENKSDVDPEVIVAFDVGSEKFRVIPISFIFDQARQQGPEVFWHPCLFEFDGRVAISFGNSRSTLKIWIFDKEEDDEDITNFGNRNWTEETIRIPQLDERRHLDLHTIAGTDQIILEFYTRDGVKRIYPSYFSYNRRKNTYKKVVISGKAKFPILCSSFLFTISVESLFSVQRKLQRHHTKLQHGK